MPIIYLASQNKHKVSEIQAILGQKYTIRGCDELAKNLSWDESGDTFRANALIKAQAVAALGAKTVMSDDSGLVVRALNGAPGIHSARYAGPDAIDEDNNKKLLEAIKDVPDDRLQAAFVCVICYLEEGREPRYFEGRCEGRLKRAKSGLRGFGYDPLFIPDGYQETFAELGDEVKNRISHRAKALQGLESYLAAQ